MEERKGLRRKSIRRIFALFEKVLTLIVLYGMLLNLYGCSKSSSGDSQEPKGAAVTIVPSDGVDLYGFIGDSSGYPIAGVVVSDGFTCTQTDAKGVYQMVRNADAKFVSYSIPSNYKVTTASETTKVALFYAELTSGKRYDFVLEANSITETNFTLICMGDPQVASVADVSRFKNETMPDLKTFIATQNVPCYMLTMGDMASDKPALFGQMKALVGSSAAPVFNTIGNHDKVATSNASEPRDADVYCATYGPLNYSFNRGNVHFICLDNVMYSNSSTYSGGFSDAQIAWMKQDLSYVGKDKMVIVFYHIPIRTTSSIKNRTAFLNALSGFAEVHLMCGHTHYNENCIITTPINTYEHIHAAACGAWWHSTINGDGTPNGYAVYKVEGSKIVDWYYKPTNLDADFQIRLYPGNVYFGGDYGSYTFGQSMNTVIVNVWNADKNWTVEAYEDDVKVATLSPMSTSIKDAWALGYHIGVLNRSIDNYSTACKHLYLHTMSNPLAKLTIKATDGFGKTYTQSSITSSFETAISY